MTKYRVNVNGEMYEVEIELMGSAPSAPAAAPAAAPAPAPAAAPAPAPAAAPAAPVAAGSSSLNSPMPGTILSVNVSAGDSVKKGQVLFVLEAMKMENEIMAPEDATVASVAVTKGSAVDSGAVLCTFA